MSGIGAVLVILLTSVCFVAYDCLVNRDIRLKKQMFVAGWEHRKRYEEGLRRSGGVEQDDDAEKAVETEFREVGQTTPFHLDNDSDATGEVEGDRKPVVDGESGDLLEQSLSRLQAQ